MKHPAIRIFALSVCTALVLEYAAVLKAAEIGKPNIIFILTDDMGWGDLGALVIRKWRRRTSTG